MPPRSQMRNPRLREQLHLRAAALGINGRSRMTKDTLRDAVARREAEEAGAPRPTTR